MNGFDFEKLIAEIDRVFPVGSFACTLTLKQADECVDSYLPVTPDETSERYDWRTVEDTYLVRYGFHGLPHLPPDSFAFYLPALLRTAIHHRANAGRMEIDALFSALRKPLDVERLAALDEPGREVVTSFVEAMAFDNSSQYQEEACRVMDERKPVE
jgi:hypothetical protein